MNSNEVGNKRDRVEACTDLDAQGTQKQFQPNKTFQKNTKSSREPGWEPLLQTNAVDEVLLHLAQTATYAPMRILHGNTDAMEHLHYSNVGSSMMACMQSSSSIWNAVCIFLSFSHSTLTLHVAVIMAQPAAVNRPPSLLDQWYAAQPLEGAALQPDCQC